MLTTEGSSFSAKSAKLSGAGRAAAGGEPTGNTSSIAAAMAAVHRNRVECNDTFLDSSQQPPMAEN
jgi:hypothetical protein